MGLDPKAMAMASMVSTHIPIRSARRKAQRDGEFGGLERIVAEAVVVEVKLHFQWCTVVVHNSVGWMT